MLELNQHNTKIILLLCLSAILSSCRVTKTLDAHDLLLDQNLFYYNGSRTFADTIQALVPQQPNKRVLGIPLRLLIYQSANENSAKEFDNWLQKT